MNELITKDGIKVQRGTIVFPGYEVLKAQAEEVAKIIRDLEVDEETIKDAKKRLAQANNAVKDLESRRIAIKKEILLPYQDFEVQVKEIVAIVKDADNEVRAKVRELEQKERDQKERELRKIWDLRFRPYETRLAFIQFEDWLTPQHLNKTQSMTKNEADMAKWMEARALDISVIMSMEDSLNILAEYRQCLDLSLAVATVNTRRDQAQAIKNVMPKHTEKSVTMFIIEDERDAKMAELLMKEHNITFKKEIN